MDFRCNFYVLLLLACDCALAGLINLSIGDLDAKFYDDSPNYSVRWNVSSNYVKVTFSEIEEVTATGSSLSPPKKISMASLRNITYNIFGPRPGFLNCQYRYIAFVTPDLYLFSNKSQPFILGFENKISDCEYYIPEANSSFTVPSHSMFFGVISPPNFFFFFFFHNPFLNLDIGIQNWPFSSMLNSLQVSIQLNSSFPHSNYSDVGVTFSDDHGLKSSLLVSKQSIVDGSVLKKMKISLSPKKHLLRLNFPAFQKSVRHYSAVSFTSASSIPTSAPTPAPFPASPGNPPLGTLIGFVVVAFALGVLLSFLLGHGKREKSQRARRKSHSLLGKMLNRVTEATVETENSSSREGLLTPLYPSSFAPFEAAEGHSSLGSSRSRELV